MPPKEEQELRIEEFADREEALHQMLAMQVCDIDTVAAVIEAEASGPEA